MGAGSGIQLRPFSQGWPVTVDIKLDRDFECSPSNIKVVIISINSNISETKSLPNRHAVPWWNGTSTKLCRITRELCHGCIKKKKKKKNSLETKPTYQQAVAKQHKYYKQANRTLWICYINDIHSQTPARYVWKMIKKLNGKYIPTHLLVLNKTSVLQNQKKFLKKLVEYFASSFHSRNKTS